MRAIDEGSGYFTGAVGQMVQCANADRVARRQCARCEPCGHCRMFANFTSQTLRVNGVEIFVCEMSMNLMGMKQEELIDYPGLKLAGVATFLGQAGTSKSTLFI